MPGTGRNTSDLNLGEERRLAFLLAAPSLTAFFKETTCQTHTAHVLLNVLVYYDAATACKASIHSHAS